MSTPEISLKLPSISVPQMVMLSDKFKKFLFYIILFFYTGTQ